MKDPNNTAIVIWMLAGCWSQDHDIGLCLGVEAILCPTNVVSCIIHFECSMLIDARSDDLKSGPIITSVMGVSRVEWFILEARQNMIFHFGSKVLLQEIVRT